MASPAMSQAEMDRISKKMLPQMTLADGSQTTKAKPQQPARDSGAGQFNISGSAIITGSHGAIAMAVARALLQHGLSGLALFDINLILSRDKILALKAEFPRARIQCFEVDVGDELEIRRAVNATAATFGSIDALVYGVLHWDFGRGQRISIPASQWRHILDINTTGTFLCTQAVAKQMILQGTGGRMVFTTSTSAHRVGFPSVAGGAQR